MTLGTYSGPQTIEIDASLSNKEFLITDIKDFSSSTNNWNIHNDDGYGTVGTSTFVAPLLSKNGLILTISGATITSVLKHQDNYRNWNENAPVKSNITYTIKYY